MFTIEYVKDLKWENEEHSYFSCIVKYVEFDQEVPSGIDGEDPTPHIHEIWVNGNAGIYGPIAAYVYVPPPPNTAEQNKAIATKHLQSTDWVNEPDVYNPANTPHLLNRDAFNTYRAQLRDIAVYPVAGDLNWPVKPTEEWSS